MVKEKKELVCMRCGHRWKQRGKRKPKMCPCCHSPNWDKRDARNLTELIVR